MNKKSFTIVEILIFTAVVALAVAAFLNLEVIYLRMSESIKNRDQAVFLVREILEAVQNLKISDWDNNISPLTSGINYYLVSSAGQWQLTTFWPGPIDNKFTRYVVFSDVYRDANDNIAESGTLDNFTRKVTAYVVWQENGQNKNISVETYITKWR